MRLLSVLALLLANCVFADTPQDHVHSMSHDVMPFDMGRTIHIFRMTTDGGIQKVEARDPRDARQIGLIRQHLTHEAAEFGKGNFGDPAHLHGADMPGLNELAANSRDLKITYADLPSGGEIVFKATDIAAVTAIHRWFGAQLSEHGADAKAE